ncbi:MAG TPA: hypothetical protein VND98_06165 [Solirubrobacterales bacterium]|nr:hypothetical protein [Solirubrobacterales bacterium]
MSSRTTSLIIGALAVAFVALAVYTIAKTNELNSHIKTLDSKATDLESTASHLESSATALQQKTVASLSAASGKQQKTLASLSAEFKKLQTCVPELETQVNGISLGESRTSYFIENNSNVSTYCQSVLYHTEKGG